jgi:hypothetical protein
MSDIDTYLKTLLRLAHNDRTISELLFKEHNQKLSGLYHLQQSFEKLSKYFRCMFEVSLNPATTVDRLNKICMVYGHLPYTNSIIKTMKKLDTKVHQCLPDFDISSPDNLVTIKKVITDDLEKTLFESLSDDDILPTKHDIEQQYIRTFGEAMTDLQKVKLTEGIKIFEKMIKNPTIPKYQILSTACAAIHNYFETLNYNIFTRYPMKSHRVDSYEVFCNPNEIPYHDYDLFIELFDIIYSKIRTI